MSFARCLTFLLCFQGALLLTGCGSGAVSKTEDPVEVEKNRQLHQEAMQKELSGAS